MSDAINAIDCATLLANTDAATVDAIITSPPYTGLPGRGDTLALVAELLEGAARVLKPLGSLTMIVGSAPGRLLLPFEVAQLVESRLALHSIYVWDRTGQLDRDIGAQTVRHDYIVHAVRFENQNAPPLSPLSVIKTSREVLNYGTGVTTPPDLADLIIEATTQLGDLIVDPFCGLCEIGVRAVTLGRSFAGGDLDEACMTIATRRLTAAGQRRA